MVDLDVIRDAIKTQKQLVFTVAGHHREVCPHILGRKDGTWHLFAWQFAGTSSSKPLPPGGAWRCFEIKDIQGDVVAKAGTWYKGETKNKRPQSCVDHIDTVVPAAFSAA